jgi:hypothetical protein
MVHVYITIYYTGTFLGIVHGSFLVLTQHHSNPELLSVPYSGDPNMASLPN